jgi:hypothetical protein
VTASGKLVLPKRRFRRVTGRGWRETTNSLLSPDACHDVWNVNKLILEHLVQPSEAIYGPLPIASTLIPAEVLIYGLKKLGREHPKEVAMSSVLDVLSSNFELCGL